MSDSYKTPGTELFSSVPVGEVVVSMIEFEGKVMVATSQHVYIMGDDKVMRPIKFEVPADENL